MRLDRPHGLLGLFSHGAECAVHDALAIAGVPQEVAITRTTWWAWFPSSFWKGREGKRHQEQAMGWVNSPGGLCLVYIQPVSTVCKVGMPQELSR